MKLTNETVKNIKLGDVVKFTYPNGDINIGVVYGLPTDGCFGVLCNKVAQAHFGLGRDYFNGTVEFEVLKEHEPVALFGLVYDFVSNHQ